MQWKIRSISVLREHTKRRHTHRETCNTQTHRYKPQPQTDAHAELHTIWGDIETDTPHKEHTTYVCCKHTRICTTHTYTKKNEQGNLIKSKETRAGEMAQ